MTDTTDTMFGEILGSAAPAMTEDVAARLRTSVLAEVRVEARPIRQRFFAHIAAIAVAATTILSGASYAVASAQPGEPLYAARQLAVEVGSAVAGTVGQALHLAPRPVSPGSSGTGTAPGSGAAGGVGHPNSGIPTSTPMPGSGPGSHGTGGGPRGGSMSATGSAAPSAGAGGPHGGTAQPGTGTKPGPKAGGSAGGSGTGSGMGPTAPSGMSGTSGGPGTGAAGGSQPRSGGMVSSGTTHR